MAYHIVSYKLSIAKGKDNEKKERIQTKFYQKEYGGNCCISIPSFFFIFKQTFCCNGDKSK
jgi:hypothetical protein